MQPTRLFDLIYYQQAQNPLEASLAEKIEGKWRTYSTASVINEVNSLSRGFVKYGLKPGDKVALIANSRPAWCFIDLALQQIGVISVPVYPNISIDDYRFILSDAEVRLVFVGDKSLHNKILSLQAEIPSLEKIATFNEIEGVTHWTAFIEAENTIEPVVIDRLKSEIKPDDLFTIIYTSGTTGTPKGVMLSHRNVLSNAMSSASQLPLETYHRILSALPICHIFERMACFLFMYRGASIYFAESLEKIGDNLREVKPHFFTTVPRLLEKVYEKLVNKSRELTGVKKRLYEWALRVAHAYDPEKPMGLGYNIQRAIVDKLIFMKWREALGGEVVGIVSGAAALQPRLAKFFNAASIPVREGYGQTESSPVIAVNRFEKGGSRIGTVGIAIPDVQVKIATDGEICVKGPNVMLGYYKRPDLTAQTIDEEGWLHTGDVGEVVDAKFLKITDRKKELFKTSGGKYVAPQVIENAYRESFFVDQIMIVGENKKTISALIVPAIPALEDYMARQGLKFHTKEEMLKAPEVHKKYSQIRDEMNKRFGEVEKVKKFVLIPDEWTIDSGEMTPTMKIKRKVLLERYRDIIADIYGEEDR